MRCWPATPPTNDAEGLSRAYRAAIRQGAAHLADGPWHSHRRGAAQMRASDPPVQYLVGTPKGRLTRLEQRCSPSPGSRRGPNVRVKLLPQDGELYVFAESRDRVAKERAMRRRQLQMAVGRLKQLSAMKLTREELLMKLGAARSKAPTAWRLVDDRGGAEHGTFSYRLDRKKLRGRAGAKAAICCAPTSPKRSGQAVGLYLQLVSVEEAFKNLKGDLAIRPIFHQDERGSRRISSSPSSPTACTSRWDAACTPRAGPHTAQRSGKICRRADDRCAHPNYRRPRAAADPLHRAGARTQACCSTS